jgi:hypothetical protein
LSKEALSMLESWGLNDRDLSYAAGWLVGTACALVLAWWKTRRLRARLARLGDTEREVVYLFARCRELEVQARDAAGLRQRVRELEQRQGTGTLGLAPWAQQFPVTWAGEEGKRDA